MFLSQITTPICQLLGTAMTVWKNSGFDNSCKKRRRKTSIKDLNFLIKKFMDLACRLVWNWHSKSTTHTKPDFFVTSVNCECSYPLIMMSVSTYTGIFISILLSLRLVFVSGFELFILIANSIGRAPSLIIGIIRVLSEIWKIGD